MKRDEEAKKRSCGLAGGFASGGTGDAKRAAATERRARKRKEEVPVTRTMLTPPFSHQ